ncbi:MAG: N-acetylmuramoyl-L-alanine amidase [Chitinophagaceae bacterium]|nr:N-acetylmuramoyl-L-alanine amidase [Chitinophagaceae bacterium]MCA6469529.1 N-acetylmuramoyl-L-alanine amidase [Chitinophagaceae bacterium]MCA6477901.1 N-acetylmuramoyl-L-alanine amidase [Chitinophagaceae bacterium]MCA6485821.1 N-acetylmuramoyl-L-alanine amidase [Chitinophagaceae bacterium]
MRSHFLPLFLFLLLVACQPHPYRSSNKMQRQQLKQMIKNLKKEPLVPISDTIVQPPYWVGTTNFNWRRPGFVIIHHTAQNSCSQTLKTFITPAAQVSAHYVICKDGTVHHMLNDYLRANHAGISRWGNMTDINSLSIGIELDNNGFEPFDSLQINSLLSVLGNLKQQYNLPTANFIGHGDISPTRKNDPNFRFPWKLLAAKGFGLWYNDTLAPVPPDFNHLQALRIIGYDMRDTTSAIRAFKRHFLQDTTRKLTEVDKQVLFDLQRKYF